MSHAHALADLHYEAHLMRNAQEELEHLEALGVPRTRALEQIGYTEQEWAHALYAVEKRDKRAQLRGVDA